MHAAREARATSSRAPAKVRMAVRMIHTLQAPRASILGTKTSDVGDGRLPSDVLDRWLGPASERVIGGAGE